VPYAKLLLSTPATSQTRPCPHPPVRAEPPQIEAAPSPPQLIAAHMPTYRSNALNAILRAMNRLLAIAVVACVILFIVAVLIAPTLDLQPSALRAQQWLTLLFSMFSLACLFVICLRTMASPFGPPGSDIQRQQGPSLTDMSCCLLC